MGQKGIEGNDDKNGGGGKEGEGSGQDLGEDFDEKNGVFKGGGWWRIRKEGET